MTIREVVSRADGSLTQRAGLFGRLWTRWRRRSSKRRGSPTAVSAALTGLPDADWARAVESSVRLDAAAAVRQFLNDYGTTCNVLLSDPRVEVNTARASMHLSIPGLPTMTFSVEDVKTALQIAAASHLKNLSVRIAAPDEASLLLHASWGSYNYALAITPASQVFLRSE